MFSLLSFLFIIDCLSTRMAPQVLNNRGANHYYYPCLLFSPLLVFRIIILKIYITICTVDIIITDTIISNIINIDSKSIKNPRKRKEKGKQDQSPRNTTRPLASERLRGLVATKSTRDITDSTFSRQLGLKAARAGREVEKVYEKDYFGEMCAFYHIEIMFLRSLPT